MLLLAPHLPSSITAILEIAVIVAADAPTIAVVAARPASVIVLNGDDEKMQKAGWKRCVVKSGLGEKSVRLGSRVAQLTPDSVLEISSRN